MVTPPYAPSFAWYRAWLAALLEGADNAEALVAANRAAAISGKDFARCLISAADSTTMMLSVAVAGGAHSLRRVGAERFASLSDHGNWRHVHLGALDATYGRTPFYPHLAPRLRETLGNRCLKLGRLNMDIHGVLAGFLGVDGIYGHILSGAARERGKEIAARIDPAVSLIDPLMRFGRETLLALL